MTLSKFFTKANHSEENNLYAPARSYQQPTGTGLPFVTVARAAAEQALTSIKQFGVADWAYNIVSNLASLAKDNKLTSLRVLGGNTLNVTANTYISYTPLLDKLVAGQWLLVSGATASQASSIQNDGHVGAFTVADTATNIQNSLDRLNVLGSLAGVSITDGKVVNFTYNQFLVDTAVLRDLRFNWIAVNGVSASQATSVWNVPNVWQVSVSDTLSSIGANLNILESLAKVNAITTIKVTDSGQILNLSSSQYAADIDAIKLMTGNFNIIQSSPAPLPTPSPTPAPSSGLHINFVEDASVRNAPSSFLTALQTAASMVEAVISNNITLNIEVGWGEIAGQSIAAGVAEGGTNGNIIQNYTTVRNELLSNVSGPAKNSLNLATANPFGSANYDVAGAQAKAWGLTASTAAGIDGVIGISSSGWSSSDYVAVLLHEITHAMGRNSGWGGTNNDTTTLDLFRYSSPGHLVTDGSLVDPSLHSGASTLQYFSINGGTTALADYSSRSDYGDWYTNNLTANDPFNAYLGSNSNAFTSADIIALGATGFQLSSAGAALASNAVNASSLMSQAIGGVANNTSYSDASSYMTSAMASSVQASMLLPHNHG